MRLILPILLHSLVATDCETMRLRVWESYGYDPAYQDAAMDIYDDHGKPKQYFYYQDEHGECRVVLPPETKRKAVCCEGA